MKNAPPAPKYFIQILGAVGNLGHGVCFNLLIRSLARELPALDQSVPLNVLLQAAVTILMLVRWFFGNGSYLREVYDDKGSWRPHFPLKRTNPRHLWLRRFAFDAALLASHAVCMAAMCAFIGSSEFWVATSMLLASDALLIFYDRNVLPRWLVWVCEGARLGYPDGHTFVRLCFRPDYPPRTWVFSNLATVAVLISTAAAAWQFRLGTEFLDAAFALIFVINSVIDFLLTQLGFRTTNGGNVKPSA